MDNLSIVQIIVSNSLFIMEIELDKNSIQKSSEDHEVLFIINEKEKNKLAFIG
jgi:hypothetical protein